MALTGPELFTQVTTARMNTLRRMRTVRGQIERYHGRQFEGRDGTPEPENYAYAFVSRMVANLANTSTRAAFSTKRSAAQERVEALELFYERWRKETNYARERERAITDMCFGMAVMVTAQVPRPGMEQNDDPPYRPQGVRLSPLLFGYDPDATCVEDARFLFHIVIEDRDDFLARVTPEDGWDMAACRELSEQSTDDLRDRKQNMSGRTAIVRYEVWCPFERLPDNDPAWRGMSERERSRYHGTIRTLAPLGKAGGGEIRKAVPYFGPRSGPYAVEGFLVVPDDPTYLGPLTACDGQIQQLNAQARANDASAENRKSIAILNANTPDAKSAVLNAKDGDVIGVPGFDPQGLANVETGGITPEARARELELRARVDRALGMSDAIRGEVSGVGTATENAIAAEAAQGLLGLWRSRVRSLDRQIAEKIAWYADQDERTVLQYQDQVMLGGGDAEEQLQALEIARGAGMVDQEVYDAASLQLGLRVGQDDGSGSFEDLEIDVEIVGDDASEQQRLTFANNFLLGWLPLLPQIAPYTPGLGEFFARAADSLRMPEIRDIADIQAAAALGLQAAVGDPKGAEGVPPGPSQKPRLQGQAGGPSRNPSQRPEGQAAGLRKAAISKSAKGAQTKRIG